MRVFVHLVCAWALIAQEEPGQPKSEEPPRAEEPAAAEPAAEPGAPKPATEEEPEDTGLGRPCDENFMKPCPEGLVCTDYRCAAPGGRGEGGKEKKKSRSEPRGFRLGVQNSFFFGFAGQLDNPRPAYIVAADFGFPTGRRARFHVEVGYQDLNGYSGLKFNPLVLGYGIPLLRDPVELELEIVLAILQTEVLFGNGYSIALSSGARAQLILVYDVGFVSLAPLGFEIRYAYGVEDVGIDTGAGANWPLMLTVGVEL